MSKSDEKKEDFQKSFDLEPLATACRDLIGRANVIYDTVFNRKDFTLVDRVYGEVSSENPKSKQLSDSSHPDELARTMVQKLLAGSLRNSFPGIVICGEEGCIEYSAHDIVVPQKSIFEKAFQTQLEFPKSLKALDPKEITIWIDPLDGEREFYRQHDARAHVVATSIGIAYKGEPLVAVVGRPFNPNEDYRVTWGIVGMGVFGFDNTTRPFDKRDKKAQIVAVPRSDVNDTWRDYILKSDVGSGYTLMRTFGVTTQFLLVLEGEATSVIFPLMYSTKYQTCAAEALFRSFGGEVTRPDNTRYSYGKHVEIHNPEGFVATIFGKEAHANTCHPEIDTQQVDLMIIGATGFTGTLATRYVIEKYGKDKNYTFAIAGRGVDKLNKLKKELANVDEDAAKRLKLYALDVLSTRSVELTLQRAMVVVSMVGPYAKYGEKVVQQASCFGTDYADITGEVLWTKRLSQRYDLNASRSESRIIHFCGVVSFPIDACTYVAVKHLRDRHGVVPEEDTIDIEPFFSMKGMQSSGGTIESWFYGFKEASKMDLNDPYFLLTENDTKPATKQPSPGAPVWIPQYKAYGHVGLYSLVDRMVIARTNCLLDYYYGTKARIHPTKWLAPSLLVAWFVTLMMVTLNLLLKFSVTRSLLGLLRRFFVKPGEGPSPEQMQQAKAAFRVIATSKNTKKAVEVSLLVTGDPGYLHTSKFLVEHGLFMADQRKGALRTRKGGFFTPAGLAKDAVLKKFSEEKDFKLTIKDL